MSPAAERIASLAELLDDCLQEKLWEFAELLYVEQTAFESAEPERWTRDVPWLPTWESTGTNTSPPLPNTRQQRASSTDTT